MKHGARITARLRSVIRQCGQPAFIDQLNPENLLPENNKRVLTIHHGETIKEAFYGSPGKNAVNVIGFLVFPRVLPDGLETVIGIHQHLGIILKGNNHEQH